MKKLLLLVVAIALGSASFAQSADEIVQQHNEAVGGQAAWSKVTSLKFSGNVIFGGMAWNGVTMPGGEAILNGKGWRIDFSLQGDPGYYIITPLHGWFLFPGQKLNILPAKAVKQSAGDLYAKDELMAVAGKQKMTFTGKESIDYEEVYTLTYTDASGHVITYFVDVTTWYLLRKVSNYGAVVKIENYSNFKKLPEGIVVPMTQGDDELKMVATIVEVNTIKDESIFKPAH